MGKKEEETQRKKRMKKKNNNDCYISQEHNKEVKNEY